MKDVIKINLKKGGRYNWKHQKERLIFLGHNFSGNGFWYQFALVEKPNEVWCECLASDLLNIEETRDLEFDSYEQAQEAMFHQELL